MFAPRNQPIVDALDRAAGWVWYPVERVLGIKPYPIGTAARRHRAFRVWPLLILAMAVAGLVVMARGHPFPGYIMLIIGFVLSTSLRQLSTVAEGQPHPDERQRAISRNGHFWGFCVALGLAIAGCFYAAIAQSTQHGGGSSIAQEVLGVIWWFPAQPVEWFALAFFLMVVETNVAVLVAGWSAPSDLPDEE